MKRKVSYFKELGAAFKEQMKFLKYNGSWLFNRNFHSEILTVAMTNKCNLECTYCWDTGNRDNLAELTTDEIKKVLDSAWSHGIRDFNPFGGEPFIRTDIFEILEYALVKGFKVTVTTNGTLVPEKKIIRLIKLVGQKYSGRLTVLVSLDGSSASENDYIRGKNSYRKTIETIQTLVKYRKEYNAGIALIVNTVVSRNNFRTMKRMLGLCNLIGVDCVHFITPTISLDSKMHMREMVRRKLVILEEEFEDFDHHINEIITLKKKSSKSDKILNQADSLEEFKGFFRRQYKQHLPYIAEFEKENNKNYREFVLEKQLEYT